MYNFYKESSPIFNVIDINLLVNAIKETFINNGIQKTIDIEKLNSLALKYQREDTKSFLEFLGNNCWCLLNFSQIDFEYLLLSNYFTGEFDNNFDKDEGDKFLMSLFCSDDKFNSMKNKLLEELRIYNESDFNKLSQALFNYDNKNYFTSALVLSSIIDSLCINKLKIENIENPMQGMYSFSKLFNYYFYSKKNQSKNIDISYYIEQEKETFSHEFIIVYLLYNCLNKFYESDNGWSNYENQPDIINRNYLMHGMYNYDKITNVDCIKLFLLLFQLVCFIKYIDKYKK